MEKLHFREFKLNTEKKQLMLSIKMADEKSDILCLQKLTLIAYKTDSIFTFYKLDNFQSKMIIIFDNVNDFDNLQFELSK